MTVEFKNTSLPDVIELQNVCQTYDKGKTYIIKDFNLLIEQPAENGKFVVILGKSGCGKSTVLRYIAGLQEPSSGEVLLYGRKATCHDPVSMVFQQYSSLPWYTVLENVMLPLKFHNTPRKQRKEQAMAIIEKVGLRGQEQKYAQYPILSGGQLQRVAIARSLINNPHILLMDEPFGALDTVTRSKMQVMLAELWESLKCTIVFVTHDLQEAVFLADDIFIMKSNPGQIDKAIHIDLPLHRDRSTKRSARFIELVQEIEDAFLGTQ